MKSKFNISILILVFSFSQIVISQNNQIQVFSVEEGLPQSQVYAMLLDHNNKLWLGTKGGGLSVFDGKHFKTFNRSTGLTDDKIFSLYEDKNHIIWIGSNKGLFSYNGLNFTSHHFSDLQSSIAISEIIEDHLGNLWLATSHGLYFQESGVWKNYGKKFNILKYNVSSVFEDDNNQIWAGSDEGLFKIQKNGFTHFTTKEGLTSNKITALGMVNGKILVGTYAGGLNVLINNQWLLLGAKKEIINHIFVDDKNEVWLATQDNGVLHINPATNGLEYINSDNGLSTNSTRMILSDPWNNKWIATSGGGLNKMYQPIFEHYNKEDGFKGNMFYALEKGADGGVWASTNANGITKILNDSIIHFDAQHGFRNIKCKALFEDHNHLLWIGTEGEGAFVKNGASFYQISANKGLSDNWVKEFATDSEGNIWVATVSGISKIRYSLKGDVFSLLQIKDFSKSKGLPDDRINCIKVDAQNRVWFGTQNGYIGYLLKEELFFSKKDQKLIKSPIKSITFDNSNRIWLATEGNGIFFADLKSEFISFTQISTLDGLNNSNVYLIEADFENHIWAGAGSGLDEIVISETDEIIYIKHYGKNEGFLGGETCSNSSTIDSDGKVWIGTLDGLNNFESNHNFKNRIAPKIYIEDITIFYESILKTKYASSIGDWMQSFDNLSLSYEDKHLSFQFNAINLLNPEKIKFSYLLDGFDREWSPVSSRNEATYSNLPIGKYTFKVKAVNEDGVWSSEFLINFKVLAPFWKTWWFYAILIIVVGLIIWIILRNRLLRFKQENAEEKEKLRIERNLLELEQKALRLQMNPHFIFNAMNTVQALIAKQDTKEARYYLAKFSKLMRKILENSRHSLISIQDEIEALDNYLYLEKLSSNDAFEYEIRISDEIQPDAYGIPPLLLQPFAENAIVHGLKELTHKGNILITFELKDNFIECVVEDNGRGRKVAKEIRQQKSSYHKSTALLITQERLATLTENVNYIPFEIIDKMDPPGTKVVVRIPPVEIY